MFQSTHPHGVRLGLLDGVLDRQTFQSTHPHGVRRYTMPASRRVGNCFNPRTRTGCDVPGFEIHDLGFIVSIHAPARGATTSVLEKRLLTALFQSTHPHGVRLVGYGDTLWAIAFQSTHPHGVRRRCSRFWWTISGFQSTHPHGVRRLGMLPSAPGARGFNPRTRTGCDSSPQ